MCVAVTTVLFLVQGHDGKTALHMTAFHGRFSRAQTLIQHGACSMFIVRVCVCVCVVCVVCGYRDKWRTSPKGIRIFTFFN